MAAAAHDDRPICRLAVLGSTGSVGTQALRAVEHLNADPDAAVRFEVVALAAGRNADVLLEQARRHRPRVVALADADAAERNRSRFDGFDFRSGPDALAQIAADPDIGAVLHAVVGAAGLPASFAAARAGKRLCLANKESLVVGGALLTDAARAGGAAILPVDSEHSAIFQALQCGRHSDVEKVILTASGGPFRDWPADRIDSARVADALDHPTYDMGGKISVDSATMFNKALELIEAVRLFDVPAEQIEIVVHPQSVVHSMVEYRDGSTLAQLSPPDMTLPIAYALTHPRRGRAGGRRMDWSQRQSLTFEPADPVRFPALRLAREALSAGPGACVALNAANEIAVAAFLREQLRFGQIAAVVEQTLQRTPAAEPSCLDDLLSLDADARRVAAGVVRALSPSRVTT